MVLSVNSVNSLVNDFPLFILVLIAIFVGWTLGRRTSFPFISNKINQQYKSLPDEYFRGLNFLLNEQSDKAIDVFIKNLNVNQDTIDTHLALGRMFCRRGEVDQAITVHKNLLAASCLNERQRFNVSLELARDYLAAGILNRAEETFHKLLEESGGTSQDCMRNLIQLYEHEKDWNKAIQIAKQLAKTGDKQAAQFIAHYYCELAQSTLQEKELKQSKKYIEKALAFDSKSVRASLLEGQLEYQEKNYTKAIEALKRIKLQNPDYISESVEPLKQCFNKAGNEEELVSYLSACAQQYPAISVVLALADIVGSHQGDTVAAGIIADYLKKVPSVRGLNRLIDFHIEHSRGKSKENLSILRDLTENLIAHKPVYHCESCGYSGKVLYWLCPSCRQWGTVKPIHGLEGE